MAGATTGSLPSGLGALAAHCSRPRRGRPSARRRTMRAITLPPAMMVRAATAPRATEVREHIANVVASPAQAKRRRLGRCTQPTTASRPMIVQATPHITASWYTHARLAW